MMNGYGYDMMGYNSSSIFSYFLIFMFIIIIGITIILIINNNHSTIKKSPIDVLNIKYAKGEISREEYLETKALLKE